MSKRILRCLFAESWGRPEPADDHKAWEREQGEIWVSQDFTELFEESSEPFTLHGM